MRDSSKDHHFLAQALDLAQIRRGFCSPNPSVGAIVTFEDKILATGYHFACGSPHAEVDALQKLSMKAEGATLYVTLEPCCYFGKTPPCVDVVVQAGIQRVVYGYCDPNPKVAGQGRLMLEERGIPCEFIPLPEITDFYASYHHWQKKKEPFITAKIALSLDGKIAGKSGEPIQITGGALQAFTHASRKISDAILTTAKTILHDDPQLNARLPHEIIAKPIYILDSELTLPLRATVFKTAKSLTVFHDKKANLERQQPFIDLGVRCIGVDKYAHGLDLNQVIQSIGHDGIHDLWVEAGGHCFSAFVKQGLVQRAFIYVALCWVGDGQFAFGKDFFFDLDASYIRWQQFGRDALCEIRW
ncbi:MAG: ribD [Gammaproteobacteria bacterium]|jgi:diaminohydroxyphosphoribosylaminopyrimidine deaminase/5-amino-6-(5-phosphoribosylamino)uracil reductase|nr:ribD [Gammaproteobacteria bacterium]